MTRSVVFVTLLALLPAAASAQEPEFLRAYESITAADVAAHVQVLASDAFEGREPGTPGEERTLAYLQDAFRSAGLQPAIDGSYLQPVPLFELKRVGTPQLTVSNFGGTVAFTSGDDFVGVAGRPLERSTWADAPVVFAGHGIVAEEYGWDDYAGLSVEGAVVVLLRGEPSSESDSTFFKGRALTVHGMSTTKVDAAAARGARAVIIVHVEATAGFPWSALSGGNFGRTQHFLPESADGALDVVYHMNESAAARLFTLAKLDFTEAMARASEPGFSPSKLPLTAGGAYTATRDEIQSHNVVAQIRGSEAPDECVVYTAHWDHVGMNPDLEGDQIFNGAVDNATGTSGLLEIAQAFAKLPTAPRRTVIFVATTAEEKGLLGSDYYAQHPVLPLRNTVAVLNLDALFPFGSFNAMTVTALGSSEVEDVLALSAARVGRVLQDDSEPQAGAYYRSDHYPFAKRGVPAVFAVGGPLNAELVEGNPVLDRFMEYLTNGYHKPADEYDPETWDLAGIEEDVRIYFETGYRLAEDSRFPNWRFGNEFRRLRDRMRATP